MKILTIALVLSFAMLSPAARAEPIPDSVLDHDYANCMDGKDDAADPDRAAYCNCVRDGMRGWDMETYGNIAAEQAQSQDPQAVPAPIQELGKACIAKVLPQ